MKTTKISHIRRKHTEWTVYEQATYYHLIIKNTEKAFFGKLFFIFSASLEEKNIHCFWYHTYWNRWFSWQEPESEPVHHSNYIYNPVWNSGLQYGRQYGSGLQLALQVNLACKTSISRYKQECASVHHSLWLWTCLEHPLCFVPELFLFQKPKDEEKPGHQAKLRSDKTRARKC